MTVSAAQEADRALTNRHVRCLMLAAQDVMGRNGLNATLRLAGLPRYIGNVPEANNDRSLRASEYAALLHSIKVQFGSGARGQLSRIGQAAFKQLLTLDPFGWNLLALTNRFLPARQRIQRSLEQLARVIAEPDDNLTVKPEGDRLVFTDAAIDSARGVEVCWLTLGEIQECVHWATSGTYDVTETACKARGDPVCVYVIGNRVG